MNLEKSMEAASAQSRRAEILVQLLKLYQDPKQALDMAIRMERFVVSGSESDDQKDPQTFETPVAAPQALVRDVDATSPDQAPARKPAKRRWTSDDEEQLARLCAEGLPLERIAQALDRTPLGVRERARVLRLKITPSPRLRAVAPDRATDGACANPEPTTARQTYAKLTKGSFGRRGRRRRSKGDGLSDQQRAEEINRFLATKGATRQDNSIETVITFMRSRDYSVVRSDNGRFLVDEREDLSLEELISRANRVRINIGREPFPNDLLKSA